MTGDARTLADRLRHYADDPMWDAHAEVPKTLLEEAIASLSENKRTAAHRAAVHLINVLRNPEASAEDIAQADATYEWAMSEALEPWPDEAAPQKKRGTSLKHEDVPYIVQGIFITGFLALCVAHWWGVV